MIEAAFRHHGLDRRYLTIEVAPADLAAAAVAGARAMGFRGFNCTIPHKLAVIPYLDGLDLPATHGRGELRRRPCTAAYRRSR